jgi:hypothetical protein
MPPDRSKKLRERRALADFIEIFGDIMPSCSYCEKHSLECRVVDKSSRCNECARRGQSCDVHGPTVAMWKSLTDEGLRLQREKKETSRILQEAASKLLRLERLEEVFREKSTRMIRRGLGSLEELEAVEREERETKERLENEGEQQHELLATDPSFPADHGLLDLDPAFDPGPEFWATLDAGGGTPQPSQGS